MREAFKPNADVMSGGQFHDSTTQRQDYIKHPLERPYHRVPDQYKKPMGEMEGVTSYKKDYTEKYAPPAQAIKHDGQRQVGGKFEGEPTYKSDYRKWDMSGRMGPYIAQDAWQPPTQPFEGETTFKHDFRKHEAARRGMIRPDEAAKMSDAPFNDRTDYRDSYIKHPLEAKYVHPKEQYKGPSAPFEDITTFKRDYKGNPGEMTRSFKPDNQAFSSGKPLEDVTTNRNDFRRWPLERPYVHQQEQYKKPEGAFESATTHNMTYRELPLERVLARRPDSANKARNAPFEGATSYNNDYKKWDMNGRGKPMMRDEYYPNTAPFEGLSTQKAHFIPHEIQKQKAFGPNRSAFQSNAKFEDSTMYRTDYTLKEMDICPALSINKVTFPIPCRRTQGGYKPVYETVTELPSGMGSPTRMQMVS
ncbi:hypothetical protein FSP39_023093 [Pinctada imbricata]|uniref:Stabilizer of axonemal microtubules 2 n=1 Tax=Pinctada imbricata TaxID=66713 RepID=A0AA88YBG5_PINIB|nr:hypothetical protein FSP39_023093 [Pinctada imbricata]